MIQYQHRCVKCKKNMVLITGRNQFPICYECQKPELQGKISSPTMKKMFDIPEEFYKKNGFLRSIKSNYLKYGKLTEKQIDAFKKTVKEMKKCASQSDTDKAK